MSQNINTKEDLHEAFGKRLAFLRKEKGLTQEQLAHQIKKEPVFVAYMEGGQRGASFETLVSLSKVFGVEVSDLFTFN